MNKINEDTAYFNTMLPTKYLCGVTIVYDICKDYGEGDRLSGAPFTFQTSTLLTPL